MKKLILSSFALVAFVFASNSASAQDANTTSALAVTIPTVVDISAASATQSLSFVTAGNIENGMETGAQVLTWKANKGTKVTIQALDFTAVGVTAVPVESMLEFKVGAGGTYIPMGTALGTAKPLGADLSKGSGTIDVFYKVKPGFNVDPAAYTTTITYTITAQ